MQTITKAQVLALFLGAAAAQDKTFKDLFNGPTSADTVPADQTLRTASSGTECANNAACTEDGEKCAKPQLSPAPQAGQPAGLCLAEEFCGAIGKLNGVGFFAPCFETEEAPADVDVTTYLTELESLITKNTVNFNDDVNLLISPSYNYQDGWWTIDTDGKYVEVDKSADNRCYLDDQCDANECCGSWPDNNNRRCMLKDLAKKVQNLGPAFFTPTCMTPDDETVVPENAQDDISKGALSEASEELTKFFNAQKDDAKTKAGYDDLSADEQQAWDQEYEAAAGKRDEFKDEVKALIGYAEDTCDDACKAVFEEEFLKFQKQKYEDCAADKDGIQCREADKLITATVKAMKGDGTDEAKNFFAGMTKEERTTFNEAWKEKAEKEAVNLAAAWVKDNKPKSGENGFPCDLEADKPCGDNVDMCCGNSKPEESGDLLPGILEALGDFVDANGDSGVLKHVCVKVPNTNDGTTAEWDNQLNIGYVHTCGLNAIKLASTVAAAVAALYQM